MRLNKLAEDALTITAKRGSLEEAEATDEVTLLVDLDWLIEELEKHEWNGKVLRVDLVDLPRMEREINGE